MHHWGMREFATTFDVDSQKRLAFDLKSVTSIESEIRDLIATRIHCKEKQIQECAPESVAPVSKNITATRPSFPVCSVGTCFIVGAFFNPAVLSKLEGSVCTHMAYAHLRALQTTHTCPHLTT